MRFKTVGSKADRVAVAVKNVDTVAIKQGAPVFYKSTITDFGLQVVSAEGLAAANQLLFAGIALAEIAVNANGEAFDHGCFDQVRFVRATRAAVSDSWAVASAVAIGDILGFESNSGATPAHVQAFKWVGNTLLASVASIASNASTPAAASVANANLEAGVRAMVSLASLATQASNYTGTAMGTINDSAADLFITTTLQVLIRAL